MLIKYTGKYVEIYFVIKITFLILLTYGAAISFACLCVLFELIFLWSCLSVAEFLFHFCFIFVGLAFTVSTSSLCVILVSCFALLYDSLSFPFFPLLRTFLVLFLVFRCHFFFLRLVRLLVGLSGSCSLFSCTMQSLGLGS